MLIGPLRNRCHEKAHTALFLSSLPSGHYQLRPLGVKSIQLEPSRVPPLCQKVFDVAVTEIEPEVEPHCVPNDIGRESVALTRVGAKIHSRILA